MALYDVLIRVASEIVGDQMTTTEARDMVLRLINRAAKELYESQDLVGSLREQVFNADLQDNFQITLPYYVKHIRGVRKPCGFPITVESMLPRYTTDDWTAHSLRWRLKHVTPLERSLDAASKLNFHLQAAESFDLTLYVTGSTPTAEKITESVTIASGAIAGATVNSFTDWPGVKLIRKSGPTNSNITVTDDAGNQVAFLPNNELEGRNTIIQVINNTCCCSQTPCSSNTSCVCWEILYKLHFQPFVLDFDEFPCEGYDDAIFYKSCALWWGKQDGKQDQAILANAQCNAIVEQISVDATKGVVKKFDFGKNKYANLQWWDRKMMTPLSMTQGVYPVYPGWGMGNGQGGGCCG